MVITDHRDAYRIDAFRLRLRLQRNEVGIMDEELDGLLFGIEKSMPYHQRQRSFFERCHRVVMFLIIVSGSAMFVQLGPTAAALAGAVLAALDLAIGFGTRARDHQVLFGRFADLNRRIRRSGETAAERLMEWRDDRLMIESEEPATLWALEADCYNEVVHAWGRKVDNPPVLTTWQRLLMHVWSFEDSPPHHGWLRHLTSGKVPAGGDHDEPG